MESSKSQSVEISAKSRWTKTGIFLTRGTAYQLAATGQWWDWKTKCGPEGYRSKKLALRFMEWARREPAAPWFVLVGAIAAQSSTQFVIGRSTIFVPQEDGELTCFANDVSLFRWNNHGSVMLTAAPISG